MPVPADVIRIVTSGPTNVGADVWNVVWHAQSDFSMTTDNLQTYANIIRDAWTEGWFHQSSITGFLNAGSSMDQVQVYTLDAENHVIDTAIAVTSGFVNGTGVHALPAECALVASLETGRAGRSYRGRSYLPGIDATALNANGQVDTTVQGELAVAFADLMSSINIATSGGFPDHHATLGVLSLVQSVISPITSIKVGNVMDSQRRRRNGSPESYDTQIVAPPA